MQHKLQNGPNMGTFEKIDNMCMLLMNWNLKYDMFPDVREFVDQVIPVEPPGYKGLKDAALELLYAALVYRSGVYWSCNRASLNEAQMRWNAFKADLIGDKLY